jgi:hypothetical protein
MNTETVRSKSKGDRSTETVITVLTMFLSLRLMNLYQQLKLLLSSHRFLNLRQEQLDFRKSKIDISFSENEISQSSTSLHLCFPPTLALSCFTGTNFQTPTMLTRLYIPDFLLLSSVSLPKSHFQTVTLVA